MPDEIQTPNKFESAETPPPAIRLDQVVDGVKSPVELEPQDKMIKTKVEFYCEAWLNKKKKNIYDKWKTWLLGAGSTALMVLSAFLGRVTA
jgi:hypothetical protein